MCELLEPGSSSNPSFPCQSDSATWTRASDYLAPPDRSPASGRVSFWNNCLSNSFPWSLCNLVGKPNFKTKSPKIFWAALLADLRFRWRKSTESSSKGCVFFPFQYWWVVLGLACWVVVIWDNDILIRHDLWRPSHGTSWAAPAVIRFHEQPFTLPHQHRTAIMSTPISGLFLCSSTQCWSLGPVPGLPLALSCQSSVLFL